MVPSVGMDPGVYCTREFCNVTVNSWMRIGPVRGLSRSDVSAMSDSDVGDQQMLIRVSTNFQNFVYVPFISTCGRYPVHERFPLSSSSSFAFNHPGQCNGFQLILSHNMTNKSDLPANIQLQEIPWCVGSLKNLIIRHFISPWPQH